MDYFSVLSDVDDAGEVTVLRRRGDDGTLTQTTEVSGTVGVLSECVGILVTSSLLFPTYTMAG